MLLVIQVIRLIRPLRCYEWCNCCHRQEMEVQSPPGTTVGWIKQDLSLWYTWMSIQDASGQTVLKIKGPCCTCDWCQNEFQVNLPSPLPSHISVGVCIFSLTFNFSLPSTYSGKLWRALNLAKHPPPQWYMYCLAI